MSILSLRWLRLIEGLNSLNFKLDHLSEFPEFEREMRNAMGVVKSAARALAPTGSYSGGGGLRGSIQLDVKSEGGHVIGTVYTNKEYAAYVEFGTGPKGQAEHSGTSPEVSVAYRQDGWMIPVDKISADVAETYRFRKVYSKDGELIGYATTGQRAQPFIYPALKDNEEIVVKRLQRAINKVHKSMAE